MVEEISSQTPDQRPSRKAQVMVGQGWEGSFNHPPQYAQGKEAADTDPGKRSCPESELVIHHHWHGYHMAITWHSAATTRAWSRTSQVLPHGAGGGRKGGGSVPASRLASALGVWMAACAIFTLGHRIVSAAKELPFIYCKLPCAVCHFISMSLKNMHVE